MSRALETLALCGLAVAGGALAADDAALHRCRALADAPARLACYDALPLAAAPAAPATGAATFGMETRQPEVAAITTHIEGRFEGWQPGSRIRLANGQLWQVSDGSTGAYLPAVSLVGTPRAPEACERGRKDTVVSYPGEVTRVVANFDRKGDFVYHCHILSHEDHEMMRRYQVVDPQDSV